MPRGNQTDSLDRFFPVPPPETFKALDQVVRSRFKLKSSDDFTLSCTFNSGASAFTWGENFSAQVVSAEGGSNVRVQAVGKVGNQVMQSKRSNKLMNDLFEDMSRLLRAWRDAQQ